MLYVLRAIRRSLCASKIKDAISFLDLLVRDICSMKELEVQNPFFEPKQF